MQEISSEQKAAEPAARTRLSPRPALAAGAAVLLAAAVIGSWQLGALSNSARTHVYAASVGDATVRVSGDHAELIVKHLPQLGAGKIYEVWLKRGSAAPQPAKALFGVDTAGRGDVVVPGSVHGVTTLMVTAEPDGGTPAPTSAPVIVAPLS